MDCRFNTRLHRRTLADIWQLTGSREYLQRRNLQLFHAIIFGNGWQMNSPKLWHGWKHAKDQSEQTNQGSQMDGRSTEELVQAGLCYEDSARSLAVLRPRLSTFEMPCAHDEIKHELLLDFADMVKGNNTSWGMFIRTCNEFVNEKCVLQFRMICISNKLMLVFLNNIYTHLVTFQ